MSIDGVLVPGHDRASGQVVGDRPQRPMDEHPHGTLAAAHHLADLARAHLVDEPQHQGLPALVGQARRSARQARATSSRVHRGRLRVIGRRDVGGEVERSDAGGVGCSAVRWRACCGRSGTARRGTSSPRRGPAPSKSGQTTQRPEEDLLGHVLGGMVVTCLVEGEAVHLGHVLAIERLEPAADRDGQHPRRCDRRRAAPAAAAAAPPSPS